MKLWWGVIIGLFLVLSLLFGVAASMGWLSAGAVTQWMQAAGQSAGGAAAVALAVILLLAGDLFFPIPSSVVMTLSGALLGFWGGLAASFAGAMGSAWLGFGLCRRFGRRAFERLVGEKDAVHVTRWLEEKGAWGILLSRGVPMLTEVASCAAGLTRMSWRVFSALSIAGTLPLCAAYAWAGSHGIRAGFGWLLLLAFLLPAAGYAAVRLARWPRRERWR